MLLDQLAKRKLIHPPGFVISNCAYLTITGSVAYGCADTSIKSTMPDYDMYGFCIPPLNMVFPHLAGHIHGFGHAPQAFEQWQQHHIQDDSSSKEWDFQIFSIVKYFELCRQGNPNVVDSLFTPENCVSHITQVGRLVRDHRRLFISKEIWAKFRGYAFSQMAKLKSKQSRGLNAVKKFEEDHQISNKTKMNDILVEIRRRGLKFEPCNVDKRSQRLKEIHGSTKRDSDVGGTEATAE